VSVHGGGKGFLLPFSSGFRLPAGPYSLLSDPTSGSIAKSKVAEASVFHAVIKVKRLELYFPAYVFMARYLT
jgi:hypothetical protein